MKANKTILLIGSVNLNSIPLGGQESKNQILRKHLLNKGYQVKVLDTKNWKSNPFILLRVLLTPFISRDVTIMSLASLSGLRVLTYFRITGQMSKNKTCLYMVLGGWFPEFLRQRKSKLKFYHDLTAIFVQSVKMQENLRILGLDNVHFMPNYKEIPQLKISNGGQGESGSYKFMYLSRIDEDKGAGYIISSLDKLRQRRPDLDISLDFYGKVAPEYEDTFKGMILDRPYLTYHGLIDLRKKENYELLRSNGYYAFLFYTSYIGEGFPGVVLDAMILGVPMIVSDWNYNAEFVIHGEHGLVVPPKDEDKLATAIEHLISDRRLRNTLAKNIGAKAKSYDVSEVIKQLEGFF